jgi:serine/threonine-protein kinase
VKVLDFGVARLVEDGPAEHALRTRTGQLVGTLSYMSPEQARGERGTVDARSSTGRIVTCSSSILLKSWALK